MAALLKILASIVLIASLRPAKSRAQGAPQCQIAPFSTQVQGQLSALGFSESEMHLFRQRVDFSCEPISGMIPRDCRKLEDFFREQLKTPDGSSRGINEKHLSQLLNDRQAVNRVIWFKQECLHPSDSNRGLPVHLGYIPHSVGSKFKRQLSLRLAQRGLNEEEIERLRQVVEQDLAKTRGKHEECVHLRHRLRHMMVDITEAARDSAYFRRLLESVKSEADIRTIRQYLKRCSRSGRQLGNGAADRGDQDNGDNESEIDGGDDDEDDDDDDDDDENESESESEDEDDDEEDDDEEEEDDDDDEDEDVIDQLGPDQLQMQAASRETASREQKTEASTHTVNDSGALNSRSVPIGPEAGSEQTPDGERKNSSLHKSERNVHFGGGVEQISYSSGSSGGDDDDDNHNRWSSMRREYSSPNGSGYEARQMASSASTHQDGSGYEMKRKLTRSFSSGNISTSGYNSREDREPSETERPSDGRPIADKAQKPAQKVIIFVPDGRISKPSLRQRVSTKVKRGMLKIAPVQRSRRSVSFPKW